MPKNSVSSATEPTVVAEPESTSKNQIAEVRETATDWDIFGKAEYGVARIVCQSLPGHPSDEACKTALIPTAEHLLAHIRNGHGGGFEFTIRETLPQRGKPWKGWEELKKAGAEVVWIRDEVTNHEVEQNSRALKAVLKPHQGKYRGAWQALNHRLLFNIQLPLPAASANVDDEFDE